MTYLRNDQDLEKLAIKNSIERIQNIEFKKQLPILFIFVCFFDRNFDIFTEKSND